MVYRRTEFGEQKREERVSKILEAAENLLVSRGVDGTTMQDIADEADTSIGNLYFYFKNKEQLVHELIGRAMQTAQRRANALSERVPPGPTRMALVIYCNGKALVSRDSPILRILRQTGGTALADYVMEHNLRHLVNHMAVSFPELDPIEREMKAGIWNWSGRGALNVYLGHATELDENEAIEMVIRYNLRGMGVAEEATDKAIATARAIISET